MKNLKFITLILVLVFASTACKKDLAELNEDIKNPGTVSGEYLFSNAQNDLSDQIASTNVNFNVWRLWAQHWAETQYPDESQYLIARRNIPGRVWRVLYRDVLHDLHRGKQLMRDAETLEPPAITQNKIAIAEILMVYTYHRVVTIWGNVPYTEALDIESTTTPSYDDAQTIYADLFERLDAAIDQLDPSMGSYTAGDYIYSGDVASWIKFANSLKLKMAVYVADVPELNPGAHATEALANGVLESSSENAEFKYSATVPYTNPLYEDLVLSGRSDFVAANTLVDYMNALEDPRRRHYFDENLADTLGVVYYEGGVYGATNTYANATHVDERFRTPTYNHPFMTYSEVLFYQAEMAARGLTGGDPESLYNEAITANMNEWSAQGGEPIEQSEIDAYLAQVEYSSFTDWKEALGMQMWIGFYNRGYEAWTTWRRLDYPALNVPPVGGLTEADLPVRFFYPIVEQTANGAAYSQAAAAIGGDVMTTKLFWDKN